MTQCFRFLHHGLSFIESLARHVSGADLHGMALPEVYHDRQSGSLVVQVSMERADTQQSAAIETLIHVHKGEPVDRPVGEPLSADQLLAVLPPRTRSTPTRPKRLLVRVKQREQIESLRDEVYTTNVAGLNDLVMQVALLQSADHFDALVFVTGMPTLAVHRWIEHADVMVYYPYGPDDAGAYDPGWAESRSLRAGSGLPDRYDRSASRSPNGIWVARNISKPYMAVLDAVLSGTPSHFDASGATCVWLVEPDGQVHGVSSPFVSLYFLHDFTLQHGLPTQTAALLAPEQPSEPFQIDVRLRLAAEKEPVDAVALRRSITQVERQTESLERQRRRLTSRLAELEREAQRERVLNGGLPSALAVDGTPIVPKNLWLFYDRQIAGHRQRLRWPMLQELLLNATLGELRQYRYAYCQFDLPGIAGDAAETVGFHLLGYGDVHGPRSVELTPDGDRGPQASDVTFVQDVRWRQLGYNLYIPAGFELYPPLRPDEDHPYGNTDNLLFNALLSQAVFELAQPSESVDRFFDFKHTDNLCLLFEHPANHTLVPIILRREDFKPLVDASIAHLNQTGLTIPVRYDPAAVATAAEQLATQAIGDITPQALEAAAEQLVSEMSGLLDRGLRARLDELAEQRDLRIVELNEETDTLEQWLASVDDRWQEVQHQIKAQGNEVTRQSTATERFLEDLVHGTEQLEQLAENGARNWEDLALRMAVVTRGVRQRADASLSKARDRLESAEQTFTATAQSVAGDAQKAISDLEQRLKELIRHTGHSSNALVRMEAGLQAVRQQIVALDGTRPEQGAMIVSTSDSTAALLEIQMLRTQLEQITTDRDLLSGELDAALVAQEAAAHLQGELEALRQEAERSHHMHTQLGEELHEAQAQRNEYLQQIEQLEREAAQWRVRLKDAQDDLKERDQKVTELRRAEVEAVRKTKELRAALDQLLRLETELEKSRVRIEQLEHAGQQVRERATRSGHDNEQKMEERVLGILPIRDDWQRANLAATAPGAPASQVLSGYRMIGQKLDTYLDMWDIKLIPIEPGVTLFDPSQGHAAIGQVYRDDLPDHTITQVVRDGYRLHGRVVQEAQVLISVCDTVITGNELDDANYAGS